MLEHIAKHAAYIERHGSRHTSDAQLRSTKYSSVTLVTIISIITTVVEMWIKCRQTPSESTLQAQMPTNYNKQQVHRIARKKMGLIKYWLFGKKRVKAILHSGQRLTNYEVKEMYRDVRYGRI